ncbi:unnamed protein product [Cuscuta epithymum]|uniref:F-box domain-containing protein n=1 Tax=Cuscuta epithymum TaxID=186058 RepID=A0AAV0CM12_9ASTE|nr:unnamed protein product [Cuscuta epithymum]
MALNYSHRPIFPSHIDVADLLPSDPFEMGMSTCPFERALSDTFTALSGLLNGLEIDRGEFQKDIVGPIKEDYSFVTGLDLILNSAIKLQQLPSNAQSHNTLNICSSMNQSPEKANGDVFVPTFDTISGFCTRDIVGSNNDYTNVTSEEDGLACCSDDNGEVPHGVWNHVLGYLGIKDLLSVQMACTSLCSSVKSDPLLWWSIHIDESLSDKITDDVLQLLSSRARGNVRCLSLVQCTRITDDGLRHVIEANPHLTMLCVPGCTRLSIDGILNILKAFNSKKGSCIKHLRIGGLYGATQEHYECLKSLLGTEFLKVQSDQKPHFYSRGSIYRLCDDERPIDIEACPRCEKIRMVYDCPSEGCQVKDPSSPGCRACTLCIPRCVQCGKCISDGPYQETFCLENLCTACHDQTENQEDDIRLYKHLHACEWRHNISHSG